MRIAFNLNHHSIEEKIEDVEELTGYLSGQGFRRLDVRIMHFDQSAFASCGDENDFARKHSLQPCKYDGVRLNLIWQLSDASPAKSTAHEIRRCIANSSIVYFFGKAILGTIER